MIVLFRLFVTSESIIASLTFLLLLFLFPNSYLYSYLLIIKLSLIIFCGKYRLDFDKIIYKIRAIDFDQQSFEGNLKVYDLQFLKENFKIVDMVNKKLDKNSITQYKLEERSYMAKRIISSPRRATSLIRCMKSDTISFPNNVQLLKKHLIKYVGDVKFKECNNMGDILETILIFVKRNYQDVLTK